ncbi:uncharacterized protein LOC131155023 [Malania oleifera]|uniref:uncharacterized protein LOC131155023 n=1 Tax=Malania oleifera TaxID=397392 RepID=UPI0025ADBAC2|nr:uncharacterized protein LOC131155023 [Malania oleifera]
MRLPQFPSVSSKQRKDQRLGSSRTRKKHKRLDAICEKAYNQNRRLQAELNGGGRGAGIGSAGVNMELRRSSRVRRAPDLLDVSPPPTKKRRKIGKNGERLTAGSERLKGESSSKGLSLGPSSVDMEETNGWKSRLRARVRNGRFGMEKRQSPRGKKKLFEDLEGFEEESNLEERELDEKKGSLGGGKSTVVKSRRPGRIKATNAMRNEDKEIESSSVKEDGSGRNGVEMEETTDEGGPLVLESVSGGENDSEADDSNDRQLFRNEDSEVPNQSLSEECTGNDNVGIMDKGDQDLEELERARGEEERGGTEAVQGTSKQVEDGGCHDGKVITFARLDEKSPEDENAWKVEMDDSAYTDKLSKHHIKEGRRCGLCRGGTDGKPPKRLVQDIGESENEACSGSSVSEEPNYDIWDGFGDEPGWLGRLLGPINDRFGIAGIWVHQHCAVWSPEVYFAGLGCLKNVRAALCRGRVLKCTRCGRPGATIGCRVDRCPKTYHLPCARANGCHFDHRKFLIACTDHRHLFQPHGNKYLDRIKKLKARKMKLEIRKLSNDAWRKDLEAEEKWLENCGEDEEFLKRESKRLHRDLMRIAPVYIGGPNSESEKLFQGWESVAGLQDVIQCMKEVVILPLLYPEFFNNLGLTPPRGVLLHGYPGTGKTLVVRALIGSCARGDKRIAYFARKGADCLGKYVGDAERQLRLLFQVAERCQPSIIFFDEIDGLAPRRTRQQDQTHSSVVSTLLALLDGLKSRGSVVVIGATNRPEAVDPALRRPGRFDREIYFPLPSVKDRAAILSLHTRRWPNPVTGSLLKQIARKTAGFAGADLQALCTQAAMIALKRNCPLQELLCAAGEKAHDAKRPPLPAFVVEERDWLEALACAPPPCSRREAGMAANDVVSSPLHTHLIPCLLRPLSYLLLSLHLDENISMPPPLFKAAEMIKTVILSALEKKKIPNYQWWSHVQDLLQEADVVGEIEKNLSYVGFLIGGTSLSASDILNDDTDDNGMVFEPSRVHHGGTRTSLLQNISLSSGKKSGFRILIDGSPKSGQRHVASCLLHCLVGNVEIQKVDLASISQEGHGDMVQGVNQILMKCVSVGSCIVFMPRIDLWAVDQLAKNENDSCSMGHQLSEESTSCLTDSQVHKSADTAEPDAVLRASHAWCSFVEQVEVLHVSTSLIILATSERPCLELPLGVKQFFQTDVLNCTLSTSSEYIVPRFIVQVDGNFNHNMVINSSATELARDLIQMFVHLVHYRSHTMGSHKEHKECDAIQAGPDAYHGMDHGLTNEPESRKHCPEDSVIKFPLPLCYRTGKGKSSLLLAISTFGYQILRYPHFAELCWVTSKLKEGPRADIHGPWKGWPFNTCIVRPSKALDGVGLVCSSSNVKSKEKYGLVRGLIAVGLSAYRGVYTSLTEVSSQVRKVLELLVGQVNAKIQAGKDRCQFVRILSQVAYLEDVVNSWAFTLQSLEADAQVIVANPKLTSLGSPHDHQSCMDNSVQSKGYKPTASNGGSKELGENTEGLAAGNSECIDVDAGDVIFVCPTSEDRPAITEEECPQELGHSTSVTCLQISSTDLLGGKSLNKQNGANLEPCGSENPRDFAVPHGSSVPLKQSNGFAFTESVVLPKTGICSSNALGGVNGVFSSDKLDGVKFSTSGKVPNKLEDAGVQAKDGKPCPDERHVDTSSSSSETMSLSPNSGVECLYCCCSGCLYTLHGLMQKILINEWELNGNDWTVDDVHDVVTSLSANLLSEVRKFYVTGSGSPIGENPRHEKHKKMPAHQGVSACGCKRSGNSMIVPKECGCHAINQSLDSKSNPSYIQHGPVSKFIYRNGVLIPVDTDKDVPFHCKFETLCLCSLIEWILLSRKPFD